MKPPATIRVAHRDVSLKLVPGGEIGADSARGVFDSAGGTIRIDKTLLTCDQAETVLHELLHACWPNFDIPAEASARDWEEIPVSVVAQNLAQVWRDNPKLVSWVSWALNAVQ